MKWVVDGKKKCSKCGEIKPVEHFSKSVAHPSGYKSACSSCSSKQFNAWRKRDLEAARIRERISHYVRKYKLTKEEAIELVTDRTGICPICNITAPLVVDHCHTSGKVRGLICSSCNSMLGYAKDSQKTLENAIGYLRKHYGKE